ncbi:Acg family FMN-binding oxidoreductase [Streptomyces sp. 4N509B]|uniref:Acg family FMN-binding oxidoreductase n=1 Tax=Streptomyces sp. 4N509B TaxID=3457413 RepID=UPI003FD61326
MPVVDDETLTSLVADAAAAPSMHNAQPWRFHFLRDSATLQVRMDPGRVMPHADPTTRALHLGCGAALFNLRVAAAHADFEPRTRLLPDPSDSWLLATVRLVPTDGASAELVALHPAIRRRHTSRLPFSGRRIPSEVRDALGEAARREGGQLIFPDSWHVRLLLDLVFDAEGRDAVDAERGDELARWTRHAGVGEGVPDTAYGPRRRGGRAPVRDFAGHAPVAGRRSADFEQTPQLALLGGGDDHPRGWLTAGQAMERVLLQATCEGLSTSLTSHALEWDELRWLARDPLSAMRFVHMVLRLGYGPESPATPRRPVREVLTVE